VHDLLREQQFTMARHLRDPDAHAPPPGIEERRLRIYRELFFNAIESLLAGGFPVIRQTLGEAGWKALVRAFYARHRSRTPLFPQVAGEFVEYLDMHASEDMLLPWLPELAHYEWVEQALFVSDATIPPHDRDGDLIEGVPVLSPLALPLAYRWPVSEIGPGQVPKQAPKEATTLLVHRDAQGEVRFTKIAPLVHRLLEMIRSHARTGREHLALLAREIGADPEQLRALALPVLEQLRIDGVVPGTALPTNPVSPQAPRRSESAALSLLPSPTR
jgi:hypothetical protein